MGRAAPACGGIMTGTACLSPVDQGSPTNLRTLGSRVRGVLAHPLTPPDLHISRGSGHASERERERCAVHTGSRCANLRCSSNETVLRVKEKEGPYNTSV
ncbi:unnamed protein product [Pleuronectes platessa]|uniref:Uncharacterized protein n=1 Tax=Pleuronectes platessa TaxID=8262 RepID=A0A9N7US70_PLEPL|nr:unnamed protein product [Pleuronectes platessa]